MPVGTANTVSEKPAEINANSPNSTAPKEPNLSFLNREKESTNNESAENQGDQQGNIPERQNNI